MEWTFTCRVNLPLGSLGSQKKSATKMSDPNKKCPSNLPPSILWLDQNRQAAPSDFVMQDVIFFLAISRTSTSTSLSRQVDGPPGVVCDVEKRTQVAAKIYPEGKICGKCKKYPCRNVRYLLSILLFVYYHTKHAHTWFYRSTADCTLKHPATPHLCLPV